MRKLSWSAGLNALLVFDADLTDLGPYWDGMVLANQITAAQRAMLEPYKQERMAKDGEIAHLLASTVIGNNVVEGDPTMGVWGVSAPLPDVYFLTGSELQYLEKDPRLPPQALFPQLGRLQRCLQILTRFWCRF